MVLEIFAQNLYKGRWAYGSFVAVHLFFNYCNAKKMMWYEVFGMDGNGGDMLKIITDLTDEEMARMKYARRTVWHTRGMHRDTEV